MNKVNWRSLFNEVVFYLGVGLVLFLLFSALESAKAQFGSSNRIISSPNQIELKPSSYVELDGFLNILTQNEIRFNDSAGGEYVSLKAPATVSSSVNFILPSVDGSADQFLKTDGLGNWSFDDVPLAFTPSNDNRVLRSDTSGGNIQESGVTLDDTDTFSGVNGINLTGASLINFTEISEPSTPAATLARLYFDSTEKKLASKDDNGDVIIYGEGGGASDVENSIDGSFDDEVDLFTHTAGAGAIVTTGGHLNTTEDPSPYVNLTTGTTHDHEICRTLEVGRQYEVGCFIKSTLDDVSVCYNNGTSDETCNTTYDGSNKYKYVFQRGTADTGEDVCLRITSPSTSAIEVDSCRIGEPKFSTAELGTIEDWEAFTPTGSWSTNTLYEGFKRRVGDTFHYQVKVSTTAAPDAVVLDVNVFDGAIDTSKFLAEVDQNMTLGFASCRDSSSGTNYGGNIRYTSTTAVRVQTYTDVGTSEGFASVAHNSPFTFANGDECFLEFSVPIEGLSSKETNILTSVDKDRPSSRGSSENEAISSGTVTFLDFDSENFDSDGNFSTCGAVGGHVTTTGTGCRWIAPRVGKVLSCSKIRLQATGGWAVDEASQLDIYKNGTSYKELEFEVLEGSPTAFQMDHNGCALVDVEKDDYLEIAINQGSGVAPSLENNTKVNYWDVHYVDAKALLAGLELEKYAVIKHELSSGSSAPLYTVSGAWTASTLNTEDDTENIVTLSSNQFTLQEGTYVIEGFQTFLDGCNAGKSRIRNVTDGVTLVVGNSSYGSSAASSPDEHKSEFYKKFSISSSKTYELQHWVGTVAGTCRPGLASSSGEPEIYETVKIRKLPN